MQKATLTCSTAEIRILNMNPDFTYFYSPSRDATYSLPYTNYSKTFYGRGSQGRGNDTGTQYIPRDIHYCQTFQGRGTQANAAGCSPPHPLRAFKSLY